SESTICSYSAIHVLNSNIAYIHDASFRVFRIAITTASRCTSACENGFVTYRDCYADCRARCWSRGNLLCDTSRPGHNWAEYDLLVSIHHHLLWVRINLLFSKDSRHRNASRPFFATFVLRHAGKTRLSIAD